MADSEEEPTIEQILDQLATVRDLAATIPSLKNVHDYLADMHERLSRAQSAGAIHFAVGSDGDMRIDCFRERPQVLTLRERPPEKIDPE
jgi:hypothetical protein